MARVSSALHRPKRSDKLSKREREDLVFDLINAFALVKNSLSASLLMQDLLTPSEIKNLGKRLRIAKLLLEGETVRDIVNDLHCSFATVAKVSSWIEESGEGFKQVIKKLPKRREKYYPRYKRYQQLPDGILSLFLNTLEKTERKQLEEFLGNVERKEHVLRKIQEVVDEEFKQKVREERRTKSMSKRRK